MTTEVVPDTLNPRLRNLYDTPTEDGTVYRGFEFRSADGEATPPIGRDRIFEGYAAVFDKPTRIRNWEGDFTEVIRKGAFAKAVRGNPRPKIMYEHGTHPAIGNLPIAELLAMKEDNHGLFVRGRMFENMFTEPIIQALDGGAIDDMSFRFIVPEGGDVWSPDRETRSLVKDLDVPEFGPVVFGAYSETNISLRSRQTAAAMRDETVRFDIALACLLNPDDFADTTEVDARADEPPVEDDVEVRTDDETADQETSLSAPNLARSLATSLEVRAAQALLRSNNEPGRLPV